MVCELYLNKDVKNKHTNVREVRPEKLNSNRYLTEDGIFKGQLCLLPKSRDKELQWETSGFL